MHYASSSSLNYNSVLIYYAFKTKQNRTKQTRCWRCLAFALNFAFWSPSGAPVLPAQGSLLLNSSKWNVNNRMIIVRSVWWMLADDDWWMHQWAHSVKVHMPFGSHRPGKRQKKTFDFFSNDFLNVKRTCFLSLNPNQSVLQAMTIWSGLVSERSLSCNCWFAEAH